jgi:hypothetical protein
VIGRPSTTAHVSAETAGAAGAPGVERQPPRSAAAESASRPRSEVEEERIDGVIVGNVASWVPG